ncbi:hypothetical protein DS259_13340 [Salmonella enterica subsp. indica]|nr:hypothetical protein [Salmonella enterica subsp. indica]
MIRFAQYQSFVPKLFITSVDYSKIDLFGMTVLYLVIVTCLCFCQCKIMHSQIKSNLSTCK